MPFPIRTLLFIPFVSACLAAETRPLTEWNFKKSAEGAKDETVAVPHTWNTGDSTRKDYYRGPAVYTRDLGPGEAFAGKRVFIRFEAVSTVAEIFLNGERLGEHRGGFTAFGFELTSKLAAKGPNRLEVRANNARRTDVLPLAMDFSICGGLYRQVSLVVEDTVCLNPVTDGASGLTVAYGNVSKERADFTVRAAVDNGGGTAAPARIRFTLLDKDGSKVSESVKETDLAPGAATVSAGFSLQNPHLWNGLRDPYLYSTRVTVEIAGKITDTQSLPVGFRFTRFDPKEGFFLNGEPLKIHGVNRHQDLEGVAWALKPEDHVRDATMIAEMGANAVRLAHYPHAREFLDACDRTGLLVWAEIPFANTVGAPAQDPGLEANAVSQLKELIRQQSFHPAIFCWSLFNELGMSETADYLPLLRTLNGVAHDEDPSRPTAGATFHPKKELCAIPDIMAFNNYPGWYYETPDGMDKYVALYGKAAPDKAWGVSEYGAGASINHHEPAIAKRPKSGGDWHPEEWQSRVHEANYGELNKHPRIWGTFLWCMFDFATIDKNEGDRHGVNDKGMVTRDRKNRKDTFYFYQANWSSTPVLHLLSKRATTLKSAGLTIRFYSNLSDLRVKLNGADLGAPTLYAPQAYAISAMRLRPGKITVEASGRTKDGAVVTDRAEWTVEEN